MNNVIISFHWYRYTRN